MENDEPRIDYAALVQRALRGVVREALAIAAAGGLPGAHHFLVTFRTADPGVTLPRFLRDLHPERMTIALQHQFWDLEVGDDRFAVTLAFGGNRHRLTVPFAALLSFVDPAADLALQLAAPGDARTEESAEEGTPRPAPHPPSPPATGGEVLPFARPRRP